MGDEVREECFVAITALGMILDREGERIIAQPHLLGKLVGLSVVGMILRGSRRAERMSCPTEKTA